MFWSDERPQAGDGAADDQGVDLAGAFVGVDGLGVGDEAADVVLQQDAVAAEEIIGYTRERLAAYKYPREIRFMDELPKGPSGKILKTALRDD